MKSVEAWCLLNSMKVSEIGFWRQFDEVKLSFEIGPDRAARPGGVTPVVAGGSDTRERVGPPMNPTETTSASPPPDSPFASQLATAFRGGAIMLASSVLWGLFLPRHNDPFLFLCFTWLPSAWLVFPLGAFVGWCLPKWVAGRSLLATVSIGFLVGVVASLVLAAGFWLWTNQHDLIGLVVNRQSGGYASYSYSVRLHLREQAWRVLGVVPPITTAWIIGWTVWTNRSSRSFHPIPTHEKFSPTVCLRFDHHLLRVVGWMAAGLCIFATALLLATSLMVRNVQVPLTTFLIVGPAAAGLAILGPLLGPMMNPGGGFTAGLQLSTVALPVLLSGLAPFAFRRRPVRLGTAVMAWCSFVTALLFWISTGAMSLGWSLG